MDFNYAPKYIREIGKINVLWFEPSNTYIALNDVLLDFMKIYLDNQGDKTKFQTQLSSKYGISEDTITTYYEDLTHLLKTCQVSSFRAEASNQEILVKSTCISNTYIINDKLIQINYSSEGVKLLVHPQLAHLETNKSTDTHSITYDIILNEEKLYLQKDDELIGVFPKEEFHLLQGKFAISLICVLTNTDEKDWLGTFHASTIVKNDKAIMLIGDSGNGKSTLAAFLMASGYKVIADDLTPMLGSNQSLYAYPTSISIKEGAFPLLEPLYNDFKNYSSITLNKNKGNVKYLPLNKDVSMNIGFPCHTVVHVTYEKNVATKFEKIPLEGILQTLIPDSWLSPNPKHASNFLDWLETITAYSLTYSDIEEILPVIESIKD